MRQAKIVCTLGPASADPRVIRQLIEAGMDVARLNFSHRDRDSHRALHDAVRSAAREVGRPVAVLADLAGPKIRVGDLNGGEVFLKDGADIIFTTRPVLGDAHMVSVNLPSFAREATPGAKLFADDGRLEFIVDRVEGDHVHCKVIVGGFLKNRKGLNLPQGGLLLPALTAKDREDIEDAKALGVDYFAMSFVRKAADVIEARRLIGAIPIIAKIEKPQAIENLESIADAADGLMVARGDLGVEVGAEKVPLLQKRMILAANARAKPVITATQMLETMVTSPQPTRAEVSDVANAVLDGTDALMLSAETAAGHYPVEAVRAMARIIEEVERSATATPMWRQPAVNTAPSFNNAIALAVAHTARQLALKAVAVHSETGRSAALIAAHRPAAAITAFSENPNTLARLALHWGVVPVAGKTFVELEEATRQVEEALLRMKLAEVGDEIAITFLTDQAGAVATTLLRLARVRPAS